MAKLAHKKNTPSDQRVLVYVIVLPYLSSCKFPEPRTEWSCCPGWSWRTVPADRSQTARVPAAGPRRTSTPLRPGRLARSDRHWGRSSVRWGRESLPVCWRVAWAHTGERRSDEGQGMTFDSWLLGFTELLLLTLQTIYYSWYIEVHRLVQHMNQMWKYLEQCSQIMAWEAGQHFYFQTQDRACFLCWCIHTGCGLHLPPPSLQSPDSSQWLPATGCLCFLCSDSLRENKEGNSNHRSFHNAIRI